MSLARDTISFEWKKYLATVGVIALTGLIFYLLLGMLLGQWRMFSAFERELDADIIIVNDESRFSFRGITEFDSAQIYIHPNVSLIQDYRRTFLNHELKISPTDVDRVRVIAVNTSPHSMIFPQNLSQKARALLHQPGNLMLSERTIESRRLSLGQNIDYGGRNLILVGAFKAPFDSFAEGIVSEDTHKLYQRFQSGTVNGILIRVHDPEVTPTTIAELNSWLVDFGLVAIEPRVYASNLSLTSLLGSRQVLVVFYIGGFVVLIATVIAAQALRSAIMSLRPQFGTMKALGVPIPKVIGFVVEVSIWTGVLGTMTAIAAALVAQNLLSSFDLSIVITQDLIILVSMVLLSMSALAGILSLSIVLRIRPVELLR